MRIAFAFDAAAWEIAEARHAVATLASLLETPWRLAPPGTETGPEEALVFVGRPVAAPDGAAAVIAVDGWPRWEARTLGAVRVAGEPLACLPGTAPSEHGAGAFPPEWLRAAAFTLHREEELQDERRDEWECYSGAYTRLGEIGLLERPMLNHLALALAARLERWAVARQRTLERAPRWKHGARFAVALTHDVDDVTQASWRMAWRLLRQARGVRSYAFRAGVAGVARALLRAPGAVDPYWAFEHWMGVEERHGFRSTFFFCPPDPAPRHEYDALYRPEDVVGYAGRRMRVAELIREIVSRGHEVGLHGSYLSHRDAGELGRQRAQIAAAAGREPSGTRQHFLRFDLNSTWAAQTAAGFAYDSTLGYNEALGFRAGIAAPFRPWDLVGRRAHRMWELPLTAMDGTLFRTLALDPDAAVERVRRHLEAVEEARGLALLLWHPNGADRRRFPGWWECYERTLTWLAGRPAWVAPAGEIAEWWAERAGNRVATVP